MPQSKIKHWVTEYNNLLRWLLLFAAIASAIYVGSQTNDAALLSIFLLSYIVCLNFSIPTPVGQMTFTPLLGLLSLDLLGAQTTLASLLISFIIAELLFPLWRPLWYETQLFIDAETRPSRRRLLLGQAAVYLVTFATLALFTSTSPIFIAIIYIAIQTVSYVALLPWFRCTWTQFLRQALPYLILSYLLIPTMWLAAILHARFNLFLFTGSAFLFLLFNLMWWAAWQNRYMLGQQLKQLKQLNDVAEQQRETLELKAIAQRAYEQISALIEVDQFSIVLAPTNNGRWQSLLTVSKNITQESSSNFQPDDFTRWVQQNGRVLNIDRATLHHAQKYNLTPPDPFPHRWLGFPLTSTERVLGVLILQQHQPNQVIDQWSNELLSAIVRQTSDGLENGLQHDKTVALYTSADEALNQRAEQLQAVLEATSDAIVLLDPSGEIVFSNPLATHLLQLHAPKNRLGYPENEWEQLQAQVRTNQQPIPDGSLVTLSIAEGDTRWFERTTTAVTHQEQPLGWLIVLHDITEIQERSEWREQFTDMIVHDLRNPISTLLTNFDFMRRLSHEDGQFSPETAEMHITTGTQVSQHMLDMVDSLMDAARLSAGQFIVDAEAMHLRPQVEQVARQMSNQFQHKQITFTLDAPDQLPAVWADHELVRRVLVNLLDNAVKFTPMRGRITVTLQPQPFSDSEDGLRCAILDTGPGIPADKRDAIFARFVRIDENSAKTRGSGIGLSFCKQALEIQNGRIWVEDTAASWGSGSQFIFTLPGIPHFDLGDTNR